jgi:hypothetical protein
MQPPYPSTVTTSGLYQTPLRWPPHNWELLSPPSVVTTAMNNTPDSEENSYKTEANLKL